MQIGGGLTGGVRTRLSHLNKAVVICDDVTPLQRFPRLLVTLKEQFVQLVENSRKRVENVVKTHTPRHPSRSALTGGCSAPTKHSWARWDGPPLAVETSKSWEDRCGYSFCLRFGIITCVILVYTLDEWVTPLEEVPNVNILWIPRNIRRLVPVYLARADVRRFPFQTNGIQLLDVGYVQLL